MRLLDVISFTSKILNEGIDIHAFQKLSDDETFQKACQNFKARIQGDDDARVRFNLKDLNIYKENLPAFINQVENALGYIENRSKDKNSRKGRKM